MLAASRRSGSFDRQPVIQAALWGLGVSATIELAQLFVASRSTKLSDVLVGTAAAAFGGALMLWIMPSAKTPPDRAAETRKTAWRWQLLAICDSLCLIIVFSAPFQWLNDPVRIAKRWRNLWQIPFGYAKYWSDPLEALSDVMFKLLLFASLGALLTQGLAALRKPPSAVDASAARKKSTALRRWLIFALAVVTCAVLATAIEMLQVYLPPHVPDLTDVLLATVGASVGVLAAAYSQRPP